MPNLLIFGSTGTLGGAILDKYRAEKWDVTCAVRKVVNDCDIQLPLTSGVLGSRKFDAVVFLGVPMTDKEVGFEESQVKEIFAPHCTPEFEMVDIYYGAPSSVKWYNGEKKESDSMVDTAFSIRSQWDEDTAKGRPEESDIMKKMISVF